MTFNPSLDKFYPGEPNGGQVENCAVLGMGSQLYFDIGCDGLDGRVCGFCDLKRTPVLNLRGEFNASLKIDREYFWTTEMVNSKYVFR